MLMFNDLFNAEHLRTNHQQIPVYKRMQIRMENVARKLIQLHRWANEEDKMNKQTTPTKAKKKKAKIISINVDDFVAVNNTYT